jgi:hypothetical protein
MEQVTKGLLSSGSKVTTILPNGDFGVWDGATLSVSNEGFLMSNGSLVFTREWKQNPTLVDCKKVLKAVSEIEIAAIYPSVYETGELKPSPENIVKQHNNCVVCYAPNGTPVWAWI